MSDAMSNGLTYTEVVLDFTERLNDTEREILTQVAESERRQVKRLDAIAEHNSKVMAKLARGDERFASVYDKMDGEGGINERLAANTTGIGKNADSIVKVRNLNATLTALFSGIAAFVGWNQ